MTKLSLLSHILILFQVLFLDAIAEGLVRAQPALVGDQILTKMCSSKNLCVVYQLFTSLVSKASLISPSHKYLNNSLARS